MAEVMRTICKSSIVLESLDLSENPISNSLYKDSADNFVELMTQYILN
jgi:hypothetical protein